MRSDTMRGAFFPLCIILLSWVLGGCGPENADRHDGFSAVQIVLESSPSFRTNGHTIQSIPENVHRIEISVSGVDMNKLVSSIDVTEADREAGYVEATFLVPDGSERIVSVQAWDADDVLQWEGESNPFSVPGTEVVYIEMKPIA